jgi:hypothetical protein
MGVNRMGRVATTDARSRHAVSAVHDGGGDRCGATGRWAGALRRGSFDRAVDADVVAIDATFDLAVEIRRGASVAPVPGVAASRLTPPGSRRRLAGHCVASTASSSSTLG